MLNTCVWSRLGHALVTPCFQQHQCPFPLWLCFHAVPLRERKSAHERTRWNLTCPPPPPVAKCASFCANTQILLLVPFRPSASFVCLAVWLACCLLAFFFFLFFSTFHEVEHQYQYQHPTHVAKGIKYILWVAIVPFLQTQINSQFIPSNQGCRIDR